MKIFIFPLIVCVFLSQLFAESIPLEIAEYGNKAVENRMKIKSWHIRVQRNDFHMNAPEKPEKKSVIEYYVDGIKNRVDQTFPYEKQIEGREKIYTDITSLDGEKQYSYSTETFEDGTSVALSVMPLNRSMPKFKNKMYESEYQATRKVEDFRALGFVATGMNVGPYHFTVFVEYFQQCKDNNLLTMEDDDINGVKCKKISYVTVSSSKPSEITSYHRFWISPEHGYSILRHECEPGGHSFLDHTDITVEKHQKTGLWVPVKSSFERTAIKDGSRYIKWSEYLILEYLSLNEDIPDEMFTPATMNIPAGRAVHVVPAPQEPMFWDGKKITSESETFLVSNSRRNNVVRYLMIAAGLALVCTGCLFKYFELTKKNRKLSDE